MSTRIFNWIDPLQDNKSSGFSLIELSLVLAISMILLGFAMPRFSLLIESDLEKEAQKMAKIVKDVRVQAILQGVNYQISLDTKESEYTVLEESRKQPGQYQVAEAYPESIQLKSPIEMKRVNVGERETTQLKYAGRKIEFDKIFGQTYKFRIDSTGFVDMFTIVFGDGSEEIEMSIVNIMGKTEIRKKTA